MAAILDDPRYILLADNGAVSLLGRSEQSADDVAAATAALERAGLGGWIAVASHSFHADRRPMITFERVLRPSTVDFAEAVQLCGGRCCK